MPKRKIPKSPCASPSTSRDGKTAKRKGNLTRIGSHSSESGAGRKGKEISGESSDEAEAGRHSAAVSAKGDETEDVFEDSFENFRSPSENFRSPDRSIWCEKGPIIPGVHKPDERSEPLSALESEMILYRKLKNNNVFVETFNNWPSRAYFVHEDKGMVQSSEGKYKPVDSEAYFSIVYSNNALRETEPVNSAEKYVMKLFENMGIAMKFSLNKEWTTCSGIGGRSKHEEPTSPEHEILSSLYRDGQFIRAFVKRMTNGAGKVTLRAFLNMAMVVSYGRKAYLDQYVWCHLIGGGPEETEKICVDLTPSALYHDGENQRELRSNTPSVSEKLELWDRHNPHHGRDTDKSAHNATSNNENDEKNSSVSSSKTKSSIRLVKLSDQGVYADVVGISGCDPNWPHFVVVGEVKSATEEPDGLSVAAQAQLVREMLGALSHQSYVIGILLGQTQACLAVMKIDFDQKIIFVKITSYSLLCVRSRMFNVEEMQQLFRDVVKLLNYGKSSVKEVKHPSLHVGASP